MGLNVIMMGPPGAGKGTQAGRFARERGLPKISTGDMLREAIKEQNPVALEAKALMDRGELVDDATIIAIVRDRLARPDTRPGFVLDGFPRTVGQARALDAIMEERGKGPLVVIDVVVPEQELVRRLGGRRICAKCGANAEPPANGDALLRKCGGELVMRADDDGQVVLRAAEGVRAGDAAGARLLPGAADVPRRSTARRRRSRWRTTWTDDRRRGGCGRRPVRVAGERGMSARVAE